jgi:hypothetical protein
MLYYKFILSSRKKKWTECGGCGEGREGVSAKLQYNS